MHFKIFPVTNNVVDVFYGEYGWEANEHMRFKRNGTHWLPTPNTKHKAKKFEVEFMCITPFYTVAAAIDAVLKKGY